MLSVLNDGAATCIPGRVVTVGTTHRLVPSVGGFQPTLAVDGRHAPGSGGRDCLAVGVVLHVAAGEHARHVGLGRSWLGDEVAVVVHVEDALEQVGVGSVPDGHEQPGDGQASVTSSVSTLRTTAPSNLVSPTRSSTTEFHMNSILGLLNARSCMIFEARSVSRRWIKVTFDANLVRNVASSTALSPPPATAIS